MNTKMIKVAVTVAMMMFAVVAQATNQTLEKVSFVTMKGEVQSVEFNLLAVRSGAHEIVNAVTLSLRLPNGNMGHARMLCRGGMKARCQSLSVRSQVVMTGHLEDAVLVFSTNRVESTFLPIAIVVDRLAVLK